MDPNPNPNPDPGAVGAGAVQPAWHEGIITKGADGAESLADFAIWKDKAPAPLTKFITDNMTAARSKTEGLLKVPGADDPPEAWDAVYKAMGRPEKPEEYGFTKPEKMPDGVEWRDEDAAAYASWAHAAGLNKSQAAKMQELYTAHLGEQAAAMKAAGMQMVEAERKELTEAFGPKLTEAAARAQKAAVEAGLPAELFDPTKGEFMGAPALKLVAGLTEKLERLTAEGSFGGAGTGSAKSGGYEYAKAASTDKSHPDYEAYHRGDAAVVQRVNDGWKQMPKASVPAAA